MVIVAIFSRTAAVSMAGSVLLLLTAIYAFFRLSLPQVRGTIHTAGLKGSIEILRDPDAIPHIHCSHKLDAYFGLGYVHAQDRLWQMDFQRRLGQGRLSELMGPGGLPFDRLARTLGFYNTAKKTWDLMDHETRETVTAYTAGLNAFIASLKMWRRPPEFTLLRARPELWRGADVVLMSTLMAWNLSGNYLTELLRERLVRAVGPDRAREFMPDYISEQPTSSMKIRGGAVTPAEGLNSAEDGQVVGEGVGSNLWMVSRQKCTAGGPVLANDPHLPSTNPMTWYLAHLTAPGLDVIGATTPGIPGVILGRNRFIAWGMTNLNPDVQDFFRERIDERGKLCEFQGSMTPLQIREEVVHVRNRADVKWQIAVTRHGPIINDAIGGEDADLAKDDLLKTCGPLSFQWTGMTAQNSSIRAFLQLGEARNWQEFLAALKLCAVPAVNFGYADIYGNIGCHAAGSVPVRKSGDGSRPATGWSGDYEWNDSIPFEALPHACNPKENYIVSVNCLPPDPESDWFLTSDWVEPYRFERITELLSARDRLNLDDHVLIQKDTLSGVAREMIPLLLPRVSADDALTAHAVELLKNWNLRVDRESVAATIFSAWNMHLLRALALEEVGAKLFSAYEPWSSWSNRFVQNALKGAIRTQPDAGRAVSEALKAALQDLSSRLGGNIDEWKWGRVHRATLPHMPLNRVPYLRPFFSRSVPTGGDWSTVNFGAWMSRTPFLQRNIPGYRQIIDLSRLDGGVFIHASGQSGHFLSGYFDNFLDDWADVKYRPMRFERSAIETVAKDKLILKPEPAR